ncbi:MAG TPA: DNA photolyase [bacterium]|nr:DNA photolyase [bacterium]
MKRVSVNSLLIDTAVKDSTIVQNYLKALPEAEVEYIEDPETEKAKLLGETASNGKRTIFLTRKKGHVVKQCPGTARTYRCCNYHVINQTSGCPIDCTYCILQFYQNNPVTTVYADTENLAREIHEKVQSQPERFFRIGTGELTDSLAFDDYSQFSREIIPIFTELPNVLLELKTKSNTVGNLLDMDHQGKVVCSWSVNPPEVVAGEEFKAANLAERLEAMAAVQERGCKLGLHFDPILYYQDWKHGYQNLIRRLFEVVNPDRVTWISMGSLRFPPEMKAKITAKFPKTKIVYQELIKGNDGKMRYVKPLRLRLYQKVYQWIREYGGEDLFIYFCMENAEIWERVMGWAPESNEHLDYLFAESLYRRFPDQMDSPPHRRVYEEGTPLHHEQAGGVMGL